MANIIMLLHFLWIAVLLGGIWYIINPVNSWYIPWHITIISGTLFLNLFLGFCPLTVWEEKLRKKHNPSADFQNSFLATYIRSIAGIQVGKRPIFWTSFILKVASYSISVGFLIVR